MKFIGLKWRHWPDIDIEKSTNGEDADTPTGPLVAAGDTVTWTYTISNTGNAPLSNVDVTDNITGVTLIYVSGDDNGDDILDPDEFWLYEATGVAINGRYANVGAINARGPENEPVDATDPSHYSASIQPSASTRRPIRPWSPQGRLSSTATR